MEMRDQPGVEPHEAEDDVLDAAAHVGGAVRGDLDRLGAAGQRQHDRDVVGAEAPERVLVGAQLAEVQPVAVDVEDLLAELAGVGQLLERAQPGVVLEQVTDHQRPAGRRGGVDRALGVGDRHRERLLDEAVLAGLQHAHGQLGVGRDRRGQHDRVQRRVVEQVVELGGDLHARELRRRPRRAAAASRRSTRRSSQPAIAAKLRARFGPQYPSPATPTRIVASGPSGALRSVMAAAV